MFKNYFKIAWRNLFRNKISSIINIGGLSIGLATSIIILLIIRGEFSYDRFHSNLQQIHLLMRNTTAGDDIITEKSTPGPLAAAIRDKVPEIRYAVRTTYPNQQLLRAGDKSIYETGIYAEPDFFEMMSFPAISGNPASALHEAGSIVISEGTAKKLFGNEDAIGKTIIHNNTHALKIAAVIRDVPQNSSNKFDIVLPFRLLEAENSWTNKWDYNSLATWIQLKPATHIAAVNKKLEKLFLDNHTEKNVQLFAYPFADLRLYGSFKNGKSNGGAITAIKILGVIGLFVLAIACINFMNLTTAQSETRAREVGVRKVLGARRKFIILQFLSEALVMSFIALLIGVGLAIIILPGFNQLTGRSIEFDYSNSRFWLSLLATGLLTGLAAGSYPAFYLSRFKPVKVLKRLIPREKGGSLLRKGLVTFQFVLSTFLIITTIVLFRQMEFVQNKTTGYDQENLIDVVAKNNTADKFAVLKTDLLKIPGVKNVSAGSDNLIRFSGSIDGFTWTGKTDGQEFQLVVTDVGYDWIKTAGLTIAEGRDFNTTFGSDTMACLVNEAAVKRMRLKGPVIGTQLDSKTVIGVVKDFVFEDPFNAPKPLAIFLNPKNAGHVFVRLENNGQTGQSLSQIEKAVKSINPDYPFEFHFIKETYQKQFTNMRAAGHLSNIIGGLAIFISCLGLFGLSAFVAERRKKEISIRKVLGASAGSIWLSLSKDFLKPVFLAFLIAAPVAGLVLQQLLQQIDYRVGLSWWIFAVAGVLCISVALMTVSFQGIKAALASPAKSLSTE